MGKKFHLDGIPDHPKGRDDCPVCGGGGLLDEGNDYGCILVACACTGEASAATLARLEAHRPDALARLRALGAAAATA